MKKLFKNQIFRGFICLLLVLMCGSCIKEIDFQLGSKEELLVIYGVLSDQPGRHLFTVSRTNPFERQVDSNPISGATLFVVDSKARKYPFVELSPGTYLLKDTLFRATSGETYYLDVAVPNVGKFRSDLEIMPAPVRMDSVYPGVEQMGYERRLQIFADVAIPRDPEGVYLRWEVNRVWRRTSIDFGTLFNDYFHFPHQEVCYMTEDPEPNIIRLFGTKRQDAFHLKLKEVAKLEADYKLFERNAFEVIQYRTNAKNYDYWYNLDQVSNQGGTIFDPPPATVRGNIYNVDNPKERILGYFEVAAVDTAYTSCERAIFSPFNIPDPCLRDFSNRGWASTYYFPPECAFCVNIKGHSTKVPKFW